MAATLSNVKRRLELPEEDTTKDLMVADAIADAQALFKVQCNREDIPDGATGLIERLAALLYRRDSSGNVQGETMGDHSVQHYVMGADLPESIASGFRAYRKVKLL